eukprot:Nitzschia sp. Nitz4//scaffold11_size288233//62572//64215//NITZ4_000746-RA/size288233-processed-gene-0.210-mRNA-1//-1//CDS//3329533990//668//frame0
MSTNFPTQTILGIVGSAIVLRALVGLHHHSGQDNYEGSRVAYGGDFEAQRHWMELTLHLPVGEWYWYDLEYWGLDYPPLTAYVSYVCGWFSHHLVGPHSVALYESRGIEDLTHKAFMRATVIACDLLVYIPAVFLALRNTTKSDGTLGANATHYDSRYLWTLGMALVQPALVLIDHGHFQYNGVALGLSLAGFAYMVKPNFFSCVIGSVLFCGALNFKQMTLYYAPVVFAYLLGRCFSQPKQIWVRLSLLGVTVITTFVLLWAPVVLHGPAEQDTSVLDRVLHVLRRIFPFQRGLFEGKVANLWCALSTKPVKIRDRLDPAIQPLLALALTLLLMLPACVRMFLLGLESRPSSTISSSQAGDIATTRRHWNLLLWASMSSALSFFLASFQVHEKSILMALAPSSFLLFQDSTFVEWFSLVCVWTLWPLLQTDRLDIPYATCNIIFLCLVYMRRAQKKLSAQEEEGMELPSSCFAQLPWSLIPVLTLAIMTLLHIAECTLPVPSHLPDLYEVLFSVFGCGMFCLTWGITCIKLYWGPWNQPPSKEKQT